MIVEQRSIVAVNCSLLSSKDRLTKSGGGKGKESGDLGGPLLYI